MKFLIEALLALMLIFSLAACGGGDDTDADAGANGDADAGVVEEGDGEESELGVGEEPITTEEAEG